MLNDTTTTALSVELQETIGTLDRQAHATAIRTDDDLNAAITFLADLSVASKNVKAKKEEVTKPLNEALRKVRELFAPYEQKLENATLFVKSAILKYQSDLAAKAAKKEAVIAEKVEMGKLTFEQGAAKISNVKRLDTTVRADSGAAVTFRTKRTPVIVDASKLPRQYLVANMVLINRDALAGVQIPGVEVKEEKIPVVGRVN